MDHAARHRLPCASALLRHQMGAPLACLLLALTGCGGIGSTPEQANGVDRIDPAGAAAIQAPIMVDPALQQSANIDTVRPPTAPDPLSVPPDSVDPVRGGPTKPARSTVALSSAPCPECANATGAVTLVALAARQPDARIAGCAAGMTYATGWADRLPTGFPLPSAARVTEAAGNESGACHVRAVTMTAAAPVEALAARIGAQLMTAGYRVEHRRQDAVDMLGGTRGPMRFRIFITAFDANNSDIRLLTTTE